MNLVQVFINKIYKKEGPRCVLGPEQAIKSAQGKVVFHVATEEGSCLLSSACLVHNNNKGRRTHRQLSKH